MSTPHICSACRRKILASIRRYGAGQLRAASMFVSLAHIRPPAGDKKPDHVLPVRYVDNHKNRQSRLQQAGKIRKSVYPSGSPADFLENLFEEGRATPPTSTILPTSATQAATLELYERFEMLKGLVYDSNVPIDGIWKYFVTFFNAQTWVTGNPDRQIPRPLAFEAVTGDLLDRLKKEREHSPLAENLPTVTEITRVYAFLGLLHTTDWITLVYDLLRKLSELSTTAAHTQNEKPAPALTGSDLAATIAISEDILGAWKVLCYHDTLRRGKFSGAERPYDDWHFLHEQFLHKSGIINFGRVKLKGGLNEVFLSLWPRCPKVHVSSVTAAALVTFSLLTDVTHPSLKNIKANRFIFAIARLLVNSQCSVTDILRLKTTDYIIKDNIIDWSSVLSRAQAIANPPTTRCPEIQHSAIRPLDFNSPLLSKRLSRAMAEKDLRRIDQLWGETMVSAHSTTTAFRESGQEDKTGLCATDNVAKEIDGKAQNMLSQESCNQFILAYMGLRQHSRAVDVWNYMIETSLHPNLSTWHAMLEGCRRSSSVKDLDNVWTRLQTSILLPDVACWRSRINGLLECGKPEQAIRALDEMGRNWRESTKTPKPKDKRPSSTNSAAKPTIETINDVLSGLLNRGLKDVANRVLAWGDGFGLKPDIVTFNILIRDFIRSGRIQAVPSFLAQMQKQGIQADVATFTTILDEAFKASELRTPEEQLEITDLVFSEMEAAGVQPNQHTYSKIISLLLQSQPNDMTAVKAILSRMTAQKVELPRSIYTILVQHYFDTDPPDLESVRLLLERIRLSGAIMDHIFWDRVIEGYARVGDTANALVILGRVDAEASRVGWGVLECVVRALVEGGEMDVARQVVRNVRVDRGGPLGEEEKGVEGQHRFWRMVVGAGLMDA